MSFLRPESSDVPFHRRAARGAASALALLTVLLGAGCASTGGDADAEDDPTLVAEAEVPFEALPPSTATTETDEESESEVPAAIAESERRLNEIEAGTVQTYSGRAVMKEARARGK